MNNTSSRFWTEVVHQKRCNGEEPLRKFGKISYMQFPESESFQINNQNNESTALSLVLLMKVTITQQSAKEMKKVKSTFSSLNQVRITV